MTPTQVLTLGLLAVGWLAIAFPLALRSRSESVSGSITGFNQAMSVLDPQMRETSVAGVQSPAQRHAAVAGQLLALRRVLAATVASTILLGAGMLAWQGVFIPLFMVSVMASTGFVAFLRRRKVEADRARAVITAIRDHSGLPDSSWDRSARPQPRAVGQTHFAGTTDPDGSIAAHRSDSVQRFHDVRVITAEQRVHAHQGFDVIE